MFKLTGKTAVITGGGSGIGKAISLLFAQQGAEVHILELHADNAQETVSQIETAGGTARSHACDVSRQEQVKAVFLSISCVDILVNNAGIAHVGNLEKTTEEDLDRIYQVNVKGAYNCLQAAVALMKEQGRGVILNMASWLNQP
ncbi:SDR family NAD(P)-dependent oxidoreductase [Rufibacter sp. XAAS-G3-1]|uniref:SDR family NAD(P)-dependent oxidoreductase n=1 Tax=Rufibacter sp. XAAS-G3-1 TaxID=2729134 RepID=UPI0015E6E5D3|nr:SDR family NAD(P)-dependent oxidoreductase [Rufibacter sp. XAAS-G3-1]